MRAAADGTDYSDGNLAVEPCLQPNFSHIGGKYMFNYITESSTESRCMYELHVCS